MKKLIIFIWCGFVFSVFSAEQIALPTPLEIRQSTQSHIANNTQKQGIDELQEFLSATLNTFVHIDDEQLEALGTAADCVRLMRRTLVAPLDAEVLDWVLRSGLRTRRITETIYFSDIMPVRDNQSSRSKDIKSQFENAFQIMEILWRHDPEGRDEYLELILALSVVWDQFPRALHGHMGRKTLDYKPNVVERYDYFKELYASQKAKVPYSWLSAKELVFVVETPVPIDELEWVLSNETESLSSWDKKYYSIEYDYDRIESGEYSWSRGTYTLEAIQKHGGISADRAYYAVITARAFGIPAMYFSGNSVMYAWFAYLKDSGKWTLDIGRYSRGGNPTGHTRNPQTNRTMTDDDVHYIYNQSERSMSAKKASMYIAVAQSLFVGTQASQEEQDNQNILRCAQEAHSLYALNKLAWDLELDVLLAENNLQAATSLCHEMIKVFKEHPSVVKSAVQKIEKALEAEGQYDQSEILIKSFEKILDDARDDLVRDLELKKIKEIETLDVKKARLELEDLMENQIRAGAKTVSLIKSYLELTRGTDQVKYAAKFLKKYTQRLLKRDYYMPVSSSTEQMLLSYLAQAYGNAGDEKNQLKTMRRMLEIQEEESEAWPR